MRYTFGDAKRILVGTAHSKAVDVGLKINDAIQALCGANPWEHEFLRQVVRISSASPVFSLPQGSAGLVRACVNGRPVSLHGQDFQFLSSGPGDIDHAGSQYMRVSAQDVEDLGMSPVWRQPDGVACLAASYAGTRPQPPVTVHATGMDGDEITFRLEPSPDSASPAFSTSSAFDRTHPVRRITSVVLDGSTDDYISIFMSGLEPDCGRCDLIARCHPLRRVPEFHRYRINAPHRGPYDILAEVQLDPLPLVDDDDVVPFPTLEPIKCMMLYSWNFQNNETGAADNYLKQAMAWLTRFNSAKNTVQTPTVLNVPYNSSMGELSDWSVNL